MLQLVGWFPVPHTSSHAPGAEASDHLRDQRTLSKLAKFLGQNMSKRCFFCLELNHHKPSMSEGDSQNSSPKSQLFLGVTSSTQVCLCNLSLCFWVFCMRDCSMHCSLHPIFSHLVCWRYAWLPPPALADLHVFFQEPVLCFSKRSEHLMHQTAMAQKSVKSWWSILSHLNKAGD